MPQKLRVLTSLLVVFLTALACGQTCPSCTQLREARLKECQALYGSGAQLVGFRCEYLSEETACGTVKNLGQCNFNGAPQPGLYEIVQVP